MSEEMVRAARISDCGRYRYVLMRRWNEDGPMLPFLMLNPSTADALVDDPTIRRCIGFARREGFGAIHVLNLYAWRATKPADCFAAPDPVGPQNDAYLTMEFQAAVTGMHPVVAAWGAHARPDRVAAVRALAPAALDLRCLGVTKDGHPRHPLYVSGSQPLVPWPPAPSSAPTQGVGE